MPEIYNPTETAPVWEAQSYLPPVPEIPELSFQAVLDNWMAQNRLRCGEE